MRSRWASEEGCDRLSRTANRSRDNSEATLIKGRTDGVWSMQQETAGLQRTDLEPSGNHLSSLLASHFLCCYLMLQRHQNLCRSLHVLCCFFPSWLEYGVPSTQNGLSIVNSYLSIFQNLLRYQLLQAGCLAPTLTLHFARLASWYIPPLFLYTLYKTLSLQCSCYI